MEKIIVTTDLSNNSKAAIRYAMQLAAGRNAELTVLQVYYVLRASVWSDSDYLHFSGQLRKVYREDLSSFVSEIYDSLAVKPATYKVALHQNIETVEGIMEYAQQQAADYICISTHGAGIFRKIIGTVTGKLIQRSEIPVLSIPSDYKDRAIDSILYATDMEQISGELWQVIAFATPFRAAVNVVHFVYEYELFLQDNTLERKLREDTGYNVNVVYRKREPGMTMQENLEDAVREMNPALLVMVTHQDKDFLDRLLLPANAKEFAFHAVLPLMSFPKAIGQDEMTLKEKAKEVENEG